MDPYSEILSGLKLQGAIFFRGEFTAPWFINAPPSAQLAAALGLDDAHVVNFHLLTQGEATVELLSGTTSCLSAGEIAIFPHGDAHYLMSTDGACRVEDASVSAKVRARDLSPLRCGGGGAAASFVCGYMACDPFFCRSVVSGLPALLKVNIRSDPAGQWVENSLLHLLEEVRSDRVGSAAVLAKLSEALFIEALRKYAAQLPENQAGWLAAARDPYIGRALVLLHGRIAHSWTIEELASCVGLSRSAFVDRFGRLLSMPPMTYLMRLRMHLAARALVTTAANIPTIAVQVGYDSEAAFNRAFSRELGIPPARYRSMNRLSPKT
ncbi:MAG TPA: AraC family transcriptional regulator [Steroidobacteraceae bacterium]|nr:AraC family transcriptional regulator [Steroidobacteraceae bacterium]